jgi:hypothetical protein
MVVRNHVGGTSLAAGTVGPKGASAPGSGRERGISAEGRYPNESHESRRRREPTPALLRALWKGGQGHEGRRSAASANGRRAAREYLEGQAGNGQGSWRGAEKAKQSATRPFA